MSENKKKPNLKLFWLSALAVLVIFGIYRIVFMLADNAKISHLWFEALLLVYMLAACGIFIVIFVLQRGFSNKPLSAEDLPDSMSLTEKRQILDDDKKRKRRAKYLMIPLVAFVFVFMFEILEVYYFPAISNWFSSF